MQDEIVALYAAGWPVAEIRWRFGLTEEQILSVVAAETTEPAAGNWPQ